MVCDCGGGSRDRSPAEPHRPVAGERLTPAAIPGEIVSTNHNIDRLDDGEHQREIARRRRRLP